MKRKKFSIWKILQHWSIPVAILFSLYKGYKEFTLIGTVTWRSLIAFVLVLMCFVTLVMRGSIPLPVLKGGHTCKDCPKSKGCFFEQKEERREVSKMSTNSILHNIVIEDKKSVERLNKEENNK